MVRHTPRRRERTSARSVADEIDRRRSLIPQENGGTVFDAETQETSYGILVEDGLPFIFDTHRKEGSFVATVEALTEVLHPVRLSMRQADVFVRTAKRLGMLAIPYTGCFFKGNLHVYSYGGTVRGLDLSVVGDSVPESERRLRERFQDAWRRAPNAIRRAQRDLLGNRRKARYAADLEVLQRNAPRQPR